MLGIATRIHILGMTGNALSHHVHACSIAAGLRLVSLSSHLDA